MYVDAPTLYLMEHLWVSGLCTSPPILLLLACNRAACRCCSPVHVGITRLCVCVGGGGGHFSPCLLICLLACLLTCLRVHRWPTGERQAAARQDGRRVDAALRSGMRIDGWMDGHSGVCVCVTLCQHTNVWPLKAFTYVSCPFFYCPMYILEIAYL